LMVFNATFSNNSVISWPSAVVVIDTGCIYIISYNRWKSNRPWLYTTTYAISDYRH
jgi:hypothetical protein